MNNILSNADIAIIERGDLAGEIGLDNVWETQRDIIRKAKLNHTKIIVATQFLTNMYR